MKNSDSVLIIGIIFLIIMFIGEPDLHDAIITWLTK
jgi:hypothetical protein